VEFWKSDFLALNLCFLLGESMYVELLAMFALGLVYLKYNNACMTFHCGEVLHLEPEKLIIDHKLSISGKC
jgi:hypothetical protein